MTGLAGGAAAALEDDDELETRGRVSIEPTGGTAAGSARETVQERSE